MLSETEWPQLDIPSVVPGSTNRDRASANGSLPGRDGARRSVQRAGRHVP